MSSSSLRKSTSPPLLTPKSQFSAGTRANLPLSQVALSRHQWVCHPAKVIVVQIRMMVAMMMVMVMVAMTMIKPHKDSNLPQQRVALPWLSLDVHYRVTGNRPPHSYFTFADNHYFVIILVMIYTLVTLSLYFNFTGDGHVPCLLPPHPLPPCTVPSFPGEKEVYFCELEIFTITCK